MKTEVYNLIILDESGSMSPYRLNTISGCNETINTIKSSQEKFKDTQEHRISIYAFQGDGRKPSRYLLKNEPASKVEHIGEKDYEPWGNTPLYDAVGSTLADLKATIANKESAIGSVTIITDGEENSSRHYTYQQVAQMISQLKEMGWNFNFIGANIDVAATARKLNIDNHLEFCQSEEGMKEMFAKERMARMSYNARLDEEMMNFACEPSMSAEERKRLRVEKLKRASKKYFD